MKRLASLLLCGLIAFSALAEKHENVSRGFEAGKSYALGDIDTVNMFNGNITLSLPIGQPFPLSTRFSYRFMLHYNSLVWDIEEAERPVHDPPGAVEVVTVAYPDRRSNAGMGWTFGLGRLYPAFAMSNDDAAWLYETPDGGEHKLLGGEGGPWSTQDGSFIHVRKEGERMLVELPDGIVQEFEAVAGDPEAPWRLRDMYDLFPAEPGSQPLHPDAGWAHANWLHIDYEPTSDGVRWILRDSVGRTHTVTCKRMPYDTLNPEFVQSVELDGWNAHTPTYHFVYEEARIPRHSADTDKPNTSVYTGGLTDHPTIQGLTHLKLTDGPIDGTDLGFTFDMAYLGWGATLAQDDAGVLKMLTLPTKGTIEWTYGYFELPSSRDQWGVGEFAIEYVKGLRTRKITDPATGKVATWTYTHGTKPRWHPPDSYETPKEAVTSVLDPEGNVTNFYFSVWSGDPFRGWTFRHYGMPASPLEPEDETNTRFLTRKDFQGSGTLKRSTWIQQVGDRDYSRVESTKLVYEDDPVGTAKRYTLSVSDPATYDGYGHYRKQTVTTNFPGTPARETFTNYTPVTEPWLLNLYDEQRVKELPDPALVGGQPTELVTKFRFDPDTGFLEWTRTLRGTTEQASDIRNVFTPDGNGNVRQQDVYGGDDNDADGTTPRYRLVHTYDAGALATTRYDDVAAGRNAPFLSQNVVVDRGTALVTSSFDSAGAETKFTYDAAGRIETITPPGTGANVVSVDYTNASTTGTTFRPARIHVTGGDIEAEQQFDGLGRLWREKSLMPDGSWSLRETLRRAIGWTESVSEPERIPDPSNEFAFSPARKTVSSNFDAFGRAQTITKPDGSVVSVAFTGDRLTRTTSYVYTGLELVEPSPGERVGYVPVAVDQEKDGFGRLRRVKENALGHEWLESTYFYDAGGHLARVDTRDRLDQQQVRTFTYDGRGFLNAEVHPESGQATFTYDARGHVLTKTTPVAQLTFAYDFAERIKSVKDGGLPFKDYTYDRTGLAEDYSLGKVDSAVRHNYVLGKDTQVQETYTYRGLGGALSARTTSIITDGVVENTFEERYSYDANGAVQTITYPTCTACQTPPPPLTVLRTYRKGMLWQVGRLGKPDAYAGAIEYHPGGLWTTIQHTNADGTPGPVDTQTPDPAYPVRPRLIEVSRFCTGFSVSASPASVTIPYRGSTTLTASAPGAVSWRWYANGQELTGFIESSITVHPTVTTTYFARASNGTCTVDTAVAVVTVGPDCSTPAAAIEITTQPQPVSTVPVGTAVPLSVSATSGVALSYQWYEGTHEAPVEVFGAREETFTTPALTATTQYFVRVSNFCTSVDSAYAVIAVDSCAFRLQGKGPGDADFRDAAAIESSDYIFERGANGLRLEVRPELLPGQGALEYHYSWSEDPLVDAPAFTTTAALDAPRTITVTVTGSRAGFSCSRTIAFHLTPCESPLEVEAGSCFVSNNPEAYVRLGTVVPLRSSVMKAEAPHDLTDEELMRLRFTWTDHRGNVVFDGYGSAGELQSYEVPSNAADVPPYLGLTVSGAGCQRTIRMPLVVLNEPACNKATDPNQCKGTCLIGLIRVNGVARQSYAFTDREQVVFTPPATLPAPVSRYEWRRIRDGIDEVVGIEQSLPLTLFGPARYYFRGLSGGAWYTSATLTTDLVSHSPGITILPDPNQVVPSGALVTITVSVTGPAPTEYEWRVGDRYDLSKPVIGNGPTLEITVRHNRVFWCRIKQNGVWLLSPRAEVVTTCTPTVSGVAIPHPPFVAKDGFTLIGSAAHGKIRALYWYERNDDGSKKMLSSGFSSAINYYPQKPVTVLGADLVDSCGTTGSLTETTVYLCVPTIDEQPQSTVVAGGMGATLTASATPAAAGQNVTITWYEESDIHRTTPLGTGTSFTTPPLAAGTAKSFIADFRADCAASVQYTVTSAAAVVEACAPPLVESQSATVWSTTPGSAVHVSMTASGESLTYQWYEGASGDTTKPLDGRTDHDLTISPSVTTSYWCRIRSRNVCVTDSPATVVRVCSAPPIATQPQSVRVFGNAPATLSVTAGSSTNTEPITYQWQQQVDGVWNDVPGATAASFTTSAVSGATLTYSVLVSAGACRTRSASATVTMCTYPEVVPAAQATTAVVYNGTATLRLPDLSPIEQKSVTWYRGASGDRSQPMRSGVGTNFTNDTGPVTTTAQFWAEFTNQGCVSRTETYTVTACIPEITTQPASKTVPAGAATTLTIATAPISGQTYQWYIGAPGDTSRPVANATSASAVVSPAVTTSYWCRVTTSCGRTTDSAAATLTTCNLPQISSITAPPSAAAGTSVQLSIAATGANLTYQWYRGPAGDTSNPVNNGGTPTVSVTIQTPTTFWCRVTSDGGCNTDSAAVTVGICTVPSISSQPASQPLFAGNSVTLSVTASPGPLTYQWYTGTSGTTTSPISGATGTSVTVQPSATTSYWVRVMNGGCRIDSNTATVTACTFPQQVQASPASTNVASGDVVTLSLPALNPAADKTVTWYRGAPGVKTALMTSGVNASFVSAHTQSAQYWAEFTHNGCTSSTTAYTINVCKPVITAGPQNLSINSGDVAALSVTATGEGLTYQWYTGASGNTASPIPGATQRTYDASPSVSTSYWVRVTGCTTVDSAAATVSVCQRPSITQQPRSENFPKNAAFTLSVTAQGDGLRYQWYRGTKGDTSAPIGDDSPSIALTASATQAYWVRVTGSCGTADSDTALASVFPVITQHPANTTVCSLGDLASFTAAASGAEWYSWNREVNGGPAEVVGTAGPALEIAITAVPVQFRVVAVSGSAVTPSNRASVTVTGRPALTSFSYTVYSPPYYTLEAAVASGDRGRVGYRWYQGALGNTSTPLGESTSSYTSVRPPSLPMRYWVRVFYTTNPASCFADAEVTVQ